MKLDREPTSEGRYFKVKPTEERIRKVLALIKDAGWKQKTALSMYGLEPQDIKDRL